MKPTITEIRQATLEKSPHFFTRDTLKFFGQRMSMFRVLTGKSGAHYITAASYWSDRDTGRPKLMGYTLRRFAAGDLENDTPDGKDWSGTDFRSLDAVKAFLAAQG